MTADEDSVPRIRESAFLDPRRVVSGECRVAAGLVQPDSAELVLVRIEDRRLRVDLAYGESFLENQRARGAGIALGAVDERANPLLPFDGLLTRDLEPLHVALDVVEPVREPRHAGGGQRAEDQRDQKDLGRFAGVVVALVARRFRGRDGAAPAGGHEDHGGDRPGHEEHVQRGEGPGPDDVRQDDAEQQDERHAAETHDRCRRQSPDPSTG